jgi:phosphoadenosine phosphosulfate reductase
MVERFHPRLRLACSFQKESSVLVDMVARIEPGVQIFTLDTDLLFPETYEVWRRLEEHYDIRIVAYKGITLDEQAQAHGDLLWERNPARCCELRKVIPMRRALAGASAWITGMRRAQSPVRSRLQRVHWDPMYRAWKANPLVDWSDRDVFSYISKRGVPYNELHDRGYPTLGCTHCTRPVAGNSTGEYTREGRWQGRSKLECGLHGGRAVGR